MSTIAKTGSTAPACADASSASGKAMPSKAANANFTCRLLIVMDVSVYNLIEHLKEALEAPSIGDVVRQAVRLYALKYAKDGHVEDRICVTDEPKSATLKKLNVRIPTRTKQRLDMLNGITGKTYTAIILDGLGILADTADEQEAILRNLEKGDLTCKFPIVHDGSNDTGVEPSIGTRHKAC